MIKICTDLRRAKELWEKFSPQETIGDSWETAACFQDKDSSPYFLYDDQGLLPLQYEPDKNRYTFYGGSFMENRTFWFSVENFPSFFAQIPKGTKLFDLNGESVRNVLERYPEYFSSFKTIDYRYTLSISDFSRYLQTFSKKHRKNILYDLQQMQKLGYTAALGSLNDIDRLFEFNLHRFGDDSDYHDPLFKNQMKGFAQSLEKKKRLLILTVDINTVIVGVVFAAIYPKTCSIISTGYDVDHKNVGKLLITEVIKKGLSLGYHEFDFLVGDTGWKELWNMNKNECYTLEK